MNMFKKLWNAIFYKEPPRDIQYRHRLMCVRIPKVKAVNENDCLNLPDLETIFVDLVARSPEDLLFLLENSFDVNKVIETIKTNYMLDLGKRSLAIIEEQNIDTN